MIAGIHHPAEKKVREGYEMFENILVPTDFTEKSLKALDVALMISSKEGGKVTLLHVIEIIEGTDDKDFADFYKRLEKRAQEKMNEMVIQCGKGRTDINTKIAFGNRAGEIVSYAYENEVDLIILSSHRIEKVDASQGWATISYRVGILSHCPVMMVK